MERSLMYKQELNTKREYIFSLFLRIVGGVSLFAVFFTIIPYSWMNVIHEWLGMGQLPDTPVVGYLARSTSAFYAMMGGLLWIVSFDLYRYRLVLIYLGVAFSLFGLLLIFVNWMEGMPLFWSVFEGPFDIIFGLIIFLFSRRLSKYGDGTKIP